jgi:hypothetical protein
MLILFENSVDFCLKTPFTSMLNVFPVYDLHWNLNFRVCSSNCAASTVIVSEEIKIALQHG